MKRAVIRCNEGYAESMSTLTAADLDRGHLGQTITFAIGEFAFTDKLRAVTHEADLIESRTMFRETPQYDLGRTATRVTLLHAGEVTIAGTTEVEVTP